MDVQPIADKAQTPERDGTVYRGTWVLSSRDWIELLPVRLSQLQYEYADDPQGALERAHDLVAQVVEHQEKSGNDDDAEELAYMLARYRDFCNRITASVGTR
jgi:hypothetical protein